MTRLYHRARIVSAVALVAGITSCSQAPVVSPTSTTHITIQQRQFNRDGTIPACRAEFVTFTTQVHVVGAAYTTAVEITSTLIDRGKFACALPQPAACFRDPTAEVTTTSGHLIWSPKYLAIPCPGRPPGTPPVLIYPAQPLDTTDTWDLTVCRPNNACLDGPVTRGILVPGNYVARGVSDTVGQAKGAIFTIL